MALTKVSNSMADMASIAADSAMTTMVDGRIRSNVIVSGTVQATTSGNSFTFSGIPATVKRIVVSLSGVSLTGVEYIKITLGSAGGLETSGYAGSIATITHNTTVSVLNLTSSFIAAVTGSTSSVVSGAITLTLLDASTNTWACHGATARASETILHSVAGDKSLAGTLTQVAITTGGTFDAGKVNIVYE